MKKTRRWIALALAVVSVVGLAAGCGNGGKGALEVGYTLEDPVNAFFMNREYVLTDSDVNTTQDELETAGDWLTEYILDSAKTGATAFDFSVDGETFSQALNTWTLNTEKTADTDVQTDYVLTYTKSGQPLTVTVYASRYKAYAVIEWTVYIENTADENSGVISDFYGLKQNFSGSAKKSEFKLTRFKGSLNQNDAFQATQEILENGETVELRGSTGKPAVEIAPYFNLQWEDAKADWGVGGVFFSVGWPGQWHADIVTDGGQTRVTAYQESLKTYLEPGEKIRAPLMTLLFWEKDLMRSQNLWRRWVYNIAMPQPGGEPIQTQLTGNTAQTTSLTQTATTQNQLDAIQLWIDCGLEVDGWQMDAGWYEGGADIGWMDSVGGWTPDPDRFGEDGMGQIGQALAEAGWNFILWYEPERVANGSPWHAVFKDTDYLININQGAQILNLANDEVADFLIEFLLDSIEKNGVTIYRQDLCIDGSSSGINLYWKSLNTDGRVGITENKYLQNYLRYFDAIVEATGTFIDVCASGGRRIDLESMKRGVALWRCDVCYTPVATQSHSWGINFFMPYSGQGTLDEGTDTMTYAFRSNMMPSTLLPWRINSAMLSDFVSSRYKNMIAEHKTYARYQTTDYYPLTPFSKVETDWMAWQFNDYAVGDGIIQVFRRAEAEETSMRFYLNGLNPDKTYRVENIDGGSIDMTGKELMVEGISINIEQVRTALILHYYPI